MLNGSIMDYLLIVEIALIALVVAALALIYTYVLVDYLWSYDEEEEVPSFLESQSRSRTPFRISCRLAREESVIPKPILQS